MTHTASRATIGMKGGAARDPVVYPVAAYSSAFRSGQTPEMTTAPHGASCAGFSFAPGVFRGLFAVCLICHFNAPVRRFNSGCYPYIAAVLHALYTLFAPLWCGVIRCSVACRLRCQLAAALVPLLLCRGGGLLRRCGLGGLRRLLRREWLSAKVAGKVSGKVAKVAAIVVPLCAKVAGKVAVEVASVCAKVARFTPKS